MDFPNSLFKMSIMNHTGKNKIFIHLYIHSHIYRQTRIYRTIWIYRDIFMCVLDHINQEEGQLTV